MGDFSKPPNEVLEEALERGYSRLLFQQGKPVLDRELNLLADLIGFQRLAPYIGNGVPAGSNGFAVSGLNVPANDFDMASGRCLLDGHEVRLAADITYQTQPHAPSEPLPEGKSNVYLRVSSVEVNAFQDADLGNPGAENVGFETSVRAKTDWEIVVSTEEINESNHFLLAEIDTTENTVVDRRRQALTVSALRDELAELSKRLGTSLDDDGKLRQGTVAESVLADSAVSTRAIADGAVPIDKLHGSVVFNGDVPVPALGEETVVLHDSDLPAFLLVGVHYLAPRPVEFQEVVRSVDWTHRVTVFKSEGPFGFYTHRHEIVLTNPNDEAVTVNCKAYRLQSSSGN